MKFLALFAGLGIVWGVLTHLGSRIVFRPHKKRWPLRLPFEEVSFQTPNKRTLTGVYLKAQDKKPTFLFFHGRGGNISHFVSFAHLYAAIGYGIFMFDYEGFGESTGHPSEKALYQDALCAVRFLLKNKKLPPQEIVLYGHSLGNSPALFAANHLHFPFKALILQSPFLSTSDMAVCLATHTYQPHTRFYKFIRTLVYPFLYRNRFDNTRLTQNLKLPTLVCMSKADKTIPWQMTFQFAQKKGLKNIFVSADGEHDDFTWAAQEVYQFLQKL